MSGKRQVGRGRWVHLLAIVSILLTVAGCGSEDDASPDEAEATAGASDIAPMEIAGLTWTSGVEEETGEPVDNVEAYTTISPAIVAVVEATNVPAGTVFTATWTIDGLDVPEATMDVTVAEEMATAWIAFEFVRAEGRYFPLGELEVTVTSSSGDTIDASVPIQLP